MKIDAGKRLQEQLPRYAESLQVGAGPFVDVGVELALEGSHVDRRFQADIGMKDVVGCPIGLLIHPCSDIAVAHREKKMGGDMGLPVFVAKNAPDGIVKAAERQADREWFSDRVLRAKQFLSQFLRDDHAVWHIEGGLDVTIKKIVGEYAKECGVYVISV